MKKYIAAISGGPDSMAMLDKFKNKIEAVCNVNYQKREDAHIDEKIVVDFCKKNNIPCYVLHVDKEMYSSIDNNNFQTKARIIRYEFFKKICDKYDNHNLIIAHQFDDFLETAYYQKNRNSNALFYGIKEENDLMGMHIIRPLIKLRKSTLKRYCDDNEIPYALDYTNEEDDYARNRIRKTIKKWSLDAVYDFKREIDKYNKSKKRICIESEQKYKEWIDSNYSVKLFREIPFDIAQHVIYNFIIASHVVNPSSNKIKQIIEFIDKGKGNTSMRLGNGLGIFKKDNIISIIELKENKK